MALFSEGELRELQRFSEDAMNALCTIQRMTTVRDPGAVSRRVFTADPQATDIPCRLSVASPPNQLVTADQLRTAARWFVTLPLGTNVLYTDRLVVSGTDLEGNDYSITLEVAGMDAPKSYQIHTRVSGTLVIQP